MQVLTRIAVEVHSSLGERTVPTIKRYHVEPLDMPLLRRYLCLSIVNIPVSNTVRAHEEVVSNHSLIHGHLTILYGCSIYTILRINM